MEIMHNIGLDVHKKTISYCVKTRAGDIVDEGTIPATRAALEEWARRVGTHPWAGAMEATLFTGWIYDALKPHAACLKVAHPKMLKAIAASKKKNDRVDAEKIADLLRCDLLPECYMAPGPIREMRRLMRFRNLMVRLAVRMKNKTGGLLMEVGAEYDKKRLYGKRYFYDLLARLDSDSIPPSVFEMLSLSRSQVDTFERVQKKLVRGLKERPELKERVERLMTIPGVGEVTALTWALEVGEPERFRSIRRAVSYCGLCSAQRESAGKERRGPISKDRNKHLQTILIEAAKLAPMWNGKLAELHDRELERGSRNRATLAVARKLVAWLLAVDKRGTPFEERMAPAAILEETKDGTA
jgi:transposase